MESLPDERYPALPVVLVGLMGVGKTTVATRLAAALGRSLRDSDEDLEQEYGASAAELFEQHGAGVLHEREAAQLRDALAELPPPVIAAAASVIEDRPSRAVLADAYVVWLDAPPDLLAQRLRKTIGSPDRGGHRPRFQLDLDRMMARQYARRAPLFRQVADLVVAVVDSPPDRTVATVLAALGAAGRPGGGRSIDRPGPPP